MIDLQRRNDEVARRAFGDESLSNVRERENRFAEEACELLQASGMKLERLIELATYVYGRPKGNLAQEFGGAGVTMMALADVNFIHLESAVITEINRLEANIEKIRAKAAKKPDFLFAVRPIAPETAE